MTSPNPPSSGKPDPAALLALGLATQSAAAATAATPPLSPDELAAEFPRLEILELLGRGGMGAVYKARQLDLDRLVALKILRPGLDADPGFAERFTREARALAQLNHPGIVTLYEFGKTSAGRYFILMEFVDGMNLRQLLAAGRLSPREALAIVPPLCDALQYAHDRGLIHRDIKPENLLIDRLGRIKIADFGIAKIATGKPETSTSVEIAGTPAYMAPEQRDRPAEVDHRADLYALGVVFYQMLTGELPSADQLRPPSTRVQLDVRLDEIVLRALEKDPARRYAAASDFKTQIETVTSTTPATPAPRSRNIRPFAIALIACVLLATGVYFISHKSTPVASSAWNLDVIVTDQSTWPPKTFSADRALPIAGAALALLGSSDLRQPGTLEDWQAANAGPHLRLEYPRAAEGKMPDAILIPMPLNSGVIWTRKAETVTRHTTLSPTKAGELTALLKPSSPEPTTATPVTTDQKPSLQLLLEASPVTLPELAVQIRALIARHFPAAEINESPDSFRALFAKQTYPIYLQHKAGVPPTLAHEETGPSEKGFILMLTRLDQPYDDVMSLPDTGGNTHWKTFVNAGFDEARSTGVQVQLMIGSDTPKAFHEELSRLIGMLHLPRRSLVTESGETLSVYTNVFLDENDLSAVEKINAPAPSSQLRLHLTEQGSFRLNQLSQLALGRRIAILVNDQLVSAPKVMAELSGDEVDIIGHESVADESALLAAFPGPAPKTLTKTTNQAITWLQLIDAGRYAQSWQHSAAVFRKALTEDQWGRLAASTRTPLGPLISRHLKSTEHLNTLPGAPGGPHIVMQFQARFAQKESAIETVTFTRESDGTWRASGYFIK
jgi:serine/threonine protein kinase